MKMVAGSGQPPHTYIDRRHLEIYIMMFKLALTLAIPTTSFVYKLKAPCKNEQIYN